MAISVILGVNVDLVNAVSLEEVIKKLCPLAASHDHPQVHRPVPTPDAVSSGDQLPLTNKTGPAVGCGSEKPTPVPQPPKKPSLGLFSYKTYMPRMHP